MVQMVETGRERVRLFLYYSLIATAMALWGFGGYDLNPLVPQSAEVSIGDDASDATGAESEASGAEEVEAHPSAELTRLRRGLEELRAQVALGPPPRKSSDHPPPTTVSPALRSLGDYANNRIPTGPISGSGAECAFWAGGTRLHAKCRSAQRGAHCAAISSSVLAASRFTF